MRSGSAATKSSISRLREERAGGVVGIGDEDQTRPRRDRGQHAVEMMAQIRARDFDRARAENGGDQFVGDEGVLGGDDFVVETEKSVAEKLEDFIRAAAEDDVFAREAEFGGERFAQIIAAAVGIKMGGSRAARMAATAFGEGPSGFSFEASLMMLAAIGAEFARRFFDRLPRFVNREVAQLRVGVVPDRGHGAELSRNVASALTSLSAANYFCELRSSALPSAL